MRENLSDIGISGMTVIEVRGFGRQKGHTELYRGAEYMVDFLPKMKIEIIVPDDLLEQCLETIVETCRHSFKEGIIWICFDNFIAILTEINLLLLSIDIGIQMNC